MTNLMRRFRKDGLWVATVTSMVAFVGGAIAGAILEELIGGSFIEGRLMALLVIIGFLVFILLVLTQACIVLYKLYDKIGIKVRYVDDGSSGNVYTACRNVVERASQSIQVVNSYLAEGHSRPGDTPKRRAQAEYYSSLLHMASTGVPYVRIVQVKKDNDPLSSMREEDVQTQHFHDMIAKRSPTVTLLKAPADRLTTFVLVDGEHLVWQINKVTFDEAGREALSLQGAFIIHDPYRRITEHFVEYFKQLNSASTGPICLVGGRLA